jgi:hypothetical protein
MLVLVDVRNLTISALAVAALVAAGCGGSDDPRPAAQSPGAVTTTPAAAADDAQAQAAAEAQEAAKRFDEAEEAVQKGDFKAALATAKDLDGDERDRIRRKISRTIAAETMALLRQGRLASAKVRLETADRYGPTPQIAEARDAYRAAKRREAERRARARRQAQLERETKAAVKHLKEMAEVYQQGALPRP